MFYNNEQDHNKEVYYDENDYSELRVESITLSKDYTYDISVEDNHHYLLGNGIVSHNTGSIVSNCGGSGIEPLFSKYMVRRERSTTKDWKEWFTFNSYIERYLKEHNLEVTKENADKLTDPKWVMSFDINPFDKLKLASEIQKWIDSSISITFNLQED